MSGGHPSISAAKRVSQMFPSVVEEDRWALENSKKCLKFQTGYSELFSKPDSSPRADNFLQMMRNEQKSDDQEKPQQRAEQKL